MAADASLDRARAVLRNLQAVRENYRMIDDDFQLPVLMGRYLARTDVSADRKREFLRGQAGGGSSRLAALTRNLVLVAELSRPYVERPEVMNLVEFRHRDEDGWHAGSWRDSRVGYGNGRFAMDVNVVWVPKALEALEVITREVAALGLSLDDGLTGVDAAPLRAYVDDPASLRAAIATWRNARRHFETRLESDEIRRRLVAWVYSWQPPAREYWGERIPHAANAEPLWFLALALDSAGRPIAAPNSDVATDLFLEPYTEEVLRGAVEPAAVLRMLDVFTRRYPVGLLIDGLGPVVVNDAYASTAVQRRFRADLYHSPQVVWGREVNLLFLGLAHRIDAAYDASGRLRDDGPAVRSYVAALRRILETNRQAVDDSGLRHNELWSYRIEDGALRPVRYGVSSDIQLWNLTDLAVRFLLDRLPAP